MNEAGVLYERPWGCYRTIEQKDNYQIKHIKVNPRKRLSLQYHFKSVHDQIKDLACGKCSFKTASRNRLKKHIEVLHDEVENFNCKLSDNREPENIIETSEEAKRFACALCDFKTKKRYVLLKHVKAIHDKIKDLSCGLCDFTTIWKDSLQKHIKAKPLSNQ